MTLLEFIYRAVLVFLGMTAIIWLIVVACYIWVWSISEVIRWFRGD